MGQYFEVEPAIAAKHVGVIAGMKMQVRRLAVIDDVIFAAGMGRSVIRRVRRGTWTEFGPGTTAVDQGRIVGFEGIDGFSPDNIYVAGWGGEIWHWFHGGWQRIDSPTNVNLNAVACDRQKGLVFAVGDNGSMVRGAGDQWDVMVSCGSSPPAWFRRTDSRAATYQAPAFICCRPRMAWSRWDQRICLHFPAGRGGGSSESPRDSLRPRM
jgi:hypothetical protein